ncbi:MAG: hypothetical protein ACRDYU_03700 [Actinomycetes bacterium]
MVRLVARLRRFSLGAATAAGTTVRLTRRVLPGLAGLVLVSYGAWLAYEPAGFMTAGGLLLADRLREDRS